MKKEIEIKNYIEILKQIDYYENNKWIKVLEFVLEKEKIKEEK